MSKIDEVIDRLEKSCVDFDYIDEESTTIASWVTFGQVLSILNKLRPYVELGEIFVKEHFINTEYNTYELLLYKNEKERVTNLIQQIKEAEG